MKKKSLNLTKKLILKKEALAQLNPQQQAGILGGAAVTRFSCTPECETYATVQPGGHICQLCP